MGEINNTIGELLKNPLMQDMAYKYRNSIEISGFIIRKPKLIKNDKTGMESCSFILFQIDTNSKGSYSESFGCITYDKNLIAELKELKGITFVACVGKYRFNKKINTHYSQVSEMKVLYELDIPLCEEYAKKEN